MTILWGFLLRYGIRWNIRSSAFTPDRKRTFTFPFLDSLASVNLVIMESPTTIRFKSVKVNIWIENNYNPSANPFLFLVELSLFSTRVFSKLHQIPYNYGYPFFHSAVHWLVGSFSDWLDDGFGVMVSLVLLLLLLYWFCSLFLLLLFLLLVVVWLLSLLAWTFWFSGLLSLIWLLPVVRKAFLILLLKCVCFLGYCQYESQSMFLFDGNVCFFTDWTRHFLGVIGYVE